jgi:hypothetical protein
MSSKVWVTVVGFRHGFGICMRLPSAKIDGCWRILIGSTKMLVRFSAAVELLVAIILSAQELPR